MRTCHSSRPPASRWRIARSTLSAPRELAKSESPGMGGDSRECRPATRPAGAFETYPSARGVAVAPFNRQQHVRIFHGETDMTLATRGQPANLTGTPKRVLTVRDATYDLLRAYGMTTIFGNLGSTEQPFLQSFP